MVSGRVSPLCVQAALCRCHLTLGWPRCLEGKLMVRVFTYKLHLHRSGLSLCRNLLSLPIGTMGSIVDGGSCLTLWTVRMIWNDLSHNATQRLLKYWNKRSEKLHICFPFLSVWVFSFCYPVGKGKVSTDVIDQVREAWQVSFLLCGAHICPEAGPAPPPAVLRCARLCRATFFRSRGEVVLAQLLLSSHCVIGESIEHCVRACCVRVRVQRWPAKRSRGPPSSL